MTRYIFLINKIYEKGGVLDVSAAHPYQKKFEVAPPRDCIRDPCLIPTTRLTPPETKAYFYKLELEEGIRSLRNARRCCRRS